MSDAEDDLSPHEDVEEETEATDEQILLLRDLGIAESQLQGLGYAEAEELIAQIRAEKEDAGKLGRD